MMDDSSSNNAAANGIDEIQKKCDDAIESLINISVECIRIVSVIRRMADKLSVKDRMRMENRANWLTSVTKNELERVGLTIIDHEGQIYETGMAVTPINLEDFEPGLELVVETTLEPLIMGPTGVLRQGKVMLMDPNAKKVEEEEPATAGKDEPAKAEGKAAENAEKVEKSEKEDSPKTEEKNSTEPAENASEKDEDKGAKAKSDEKSEVKEEKGKSEENTKDSKESKPQSVSKQRGAKSSKIKKSGEVKAKPSASAKTSKKSPSKGEAKKDVDSAKSDKPENGETSKGSKKK